MHLPLTKSIRKFSSSAFFVTTPIYYVNANPHIGHLYTSVIADSIHRWHQLVTKSAGNSKFSTGTDEHGSKIQQAAAKNNSTPLAYCDLISEKYRDLSQEFNVNYTDFIRTSDETHKKAVEKFWNVLKANGRIFSSTYAGWYCVSDESFLTASQLKEGIGLDGRKTIISGESGHPVEWIEEVNYMFPLGAFQDDLKYWIEHSEKSIQPLKFRKILLDQLSSGPLPDISISRPTNRVHWAITVPDDTSQSIYVWLDALVNYLTAAGYTGNTEMFKKTWPPDVHVIGKDILKFHAIYWPAFLMAANLDPPKSILCHSHWIVNDEKMSKSKNNVICPFEKSQDYTNDGLRYFLLREGVAHSDGNYSSTKITRILNAELADTLGNLLNRCCGTALNPQQIFPSFNSHAFNEISRHDVTKRLIEEVSKIPDICAEHYSNYNFYKAIDNIIATLHCANLFFETFRPWDLKKDILKKDELEAVLFLTLETLRVCGILLQPIVPSLTEDLLNRVNVENNERYFSNAKEFLWEKKDFSGHSLRATKRILFKRIVV